ncbi:amidase family protein [Muriicola soli]|uniref:Amidase n=1 Tax=Muriicola soli TaxID=2507538 RepID=A0A411E830_9FLAO|nr:amidase family protein [Muriicola soli]QBA63610.1 amidase [Muriicola soli]
MGEIIKRVREIRVLILAFLAISIWGCKQEAPTSNDVVLWIPYNDSSEVAANADHENSRMRYKLIQSKVLDKNDVFRPLYGEVSKFTEEQYKALKPLILDQNIPGLQASVGAGKLTYEEIVLFYLYRIYTYELDNTTTLNTVIALNEAALEEARLRDKERKEGYHPIYGMPVLLKDNIGTDGMNTTAGAVVFAENNAPDAFIVNQLKAKGAIILGKVNLSEWAYYLCDGCPVGYSAFGGQTLNPYGRRIFETGGSSSGSGTSMAAQYAVAAVGTETSGSILSPSSQNSVVGLKPTIGLLSRSGIVPISSTLDTPGPMTRNVTDNAILLDAMMGRDSEDLSSVEKNFGKEWYSELSSIDLNGKRFGAFSNLMERDSIYRNTLDLLRSEGAEIIVLDPPRVAMDGFLSILNLDMRDDLPAYIEKNLNNTQEISVKSVADIMTYNLSDSLTRIPYGQGRFEAVVSDTTTTEELKSIKKTLEEKTRIFFNSAIDTHELDAILSINNFHAAYAAAAKYPALTIPMGYQPSGEPISLTFISRQFEEPELLKLGAAYERASNIRKSPEDYQ